MNHYYPIFLIKIVIISVVKPQHIDKNHIAKNLATKWAPLIWLAPGEIYNPLNVEDFLENVHLSINSKSIQFNKNNIAIINTKSFYLITNKKISNLKKEPKSFLYGKNPNKYPISVYTFITFCTSSIKFEKPTTINEFSFYVTYWLFFPYNEGKKVCFLGKIPWIFQYCLGHSKVIGSHVGDWERVTLFFENNSYPSKIFLSYHNYGAYYKFDPWHNYFKLDSSTGSNKLPLSIRLQGGHPVIFAANGSHGLWASGGEFDYVKIPRLIDKCGFGIPWKTWQNLKIYFDELPNWVLFKGKWGNPKSGCVLFKTLGMCELTDGPLGILRDKKDFNC